MSYRIIQWSSGNVGKHAIVTIAGREGMELVALYVYSDEKSGNDAGTIAGIGSLGVMATNDRERLLASEADCVIHTPLPSLVYGEAPDEDLETICALLASGKNVITTVGYMYPKVHGEALEARIEQACEHGGSSFHSTGVNPGWMGDMLPLVMSGICQRLDQIYVQEITNFEFYPSPSVIFDMMGFGCSPEDFENHAARYTNWLNGLFRESIQMVADGLELELDSITVHSEFEVSTRAMKIAAGDVASGTIAGQRWEWAGMVNGEKRIVHETVWRLHEAIGDQWPRGRHSVKIEGSPNMFLDFGDQWNDDVLLSTAVHAVNAIPFVCEAKPGIRTLLDLPMITARGGASG
ncbi:hypothetical protein [Candidatus Marimicrobium litorale]|uniref:Dihydrodipicolinate reductase n=1 Tax=Candidatus Marimicrobium litorale TaxID=2518991 RepID=A0ABT3T8F7_9GAMM|nr:hypothetical protein [Candidatus Marimicrobium litorale]MCX2978535.1 dihydrodipicolinate reductase [Candidatus Marimicrobium litorale]